MKKAQHKIIEEKSNKPSWIKDGQEPKLSPEQKVKSWRKSTKYPNSSLIILGWERLILKDIKRGETGQSMKNVKYKKPTLIPKYHKHWAYISFPISAEQNRYDIHLWF